MMDLQFVQQDTAGASGDNRIAFNVIGEIGAGHVADRGNW